MPNTIRIKRRASGGGAGAPSTLENAELAYNEADNILYYGTGTGGAGGSATSILAIAGSGAAVMLTGTQTIGGLKTFTLTPTFASTLTGFMRSNAGVLSASALIAADIPTLMAAKISDFDTQVRLSRLDQMAGPTASVSMNSQRITNLLDPTSAQDAATKSYVDGIAGGGLDVKLSCRAATTADITLSAPQTIDGVSVIAGDRVLVKDQSTGSQNGIYVVAAGAWTRATDADISAEVTSGLFTFVSEGVAAASSGWVLTTPDPITLGTTSLTFVQFNGAGQITAGAGLTKTGNTLSINNAGVTNAMLAGSIDLTTKVTGVLPVANGGTNFATYAIGDLLQASAAGVLAKLAAVAAGNVLISGGVGAVSSWGKVALTTHVSGILPTANGGTGIAFFTAAGPTVARTYTFRDANATILDDAMAIDGGSF